MRINLIKLTENFSLHEFECRCCHTVRLKPRLLKHLQFLWKCRAAKANPDRIFSEGLPNDSPSFLDCPHNKQAGAFSYFSSSAERRLARACLAKSLKTIDTTAFLSFFFPSKLILDKNSRD